MKPRLTHTGITMKSIAACAYSTGASALKRLSDWVARLYEQGASKQRIARYLVRWLGWAAIASAQTGAQAEARLDRPGTCSHAGNRTTFQDEFIPQSLTNYTGTLFPAGTCGIYFRGLPQAITVSATTGGNINCTPSSPEYGATATCTATPAIGFTADVWGNDCGTGSAASTCTLSNVTSAKSVSATFTAIPGYVPTGPVSSIVLDPTTPTTLYSGLDGGGVYKKVGAGNWTAASTQPTNLNVKALAIASAGTTLFAGTDGGGVFKSSNNGVDWAVCKDASNVPNSGLTNLNLRSLALTGSTLYAGTTAGVFVSTDSCASWAALNTGMP